MRGQPHPAGAAAPDFRWPTCSNSTRSTFRVSEKARWALDHAFGLGVQQVLYSVLLEDRRTVVDLWSFGGPFWARGFHAVAYPAVASVVKRMYKTTDAAAVARIKQRLLTIFDALDAVLAKQPYLGGEALNRLEITLVALLAPVCRVPEHRMQWPAMPPELAGFEASLSGRPTWNHVLRMYRNHRKSNHS